MCNGNVEVVGKIIYVPIYMSMYIQPDGSDPGIYKPDIDGLL